MRHLFKRHPIALAVCAAVALPVAPVMAQVFDPNSAAVKQAYVGEVTTEKFDAMRAGFYRLVGPLPVVPRPPICVCVTAPILPILPPGVYYPPPFGASFAPIIAVRGDGDLGPTGLAVTLNQSSIFPPPNVPGGLDVQAGFSTSRDFSIGPNGAVILGDGSLAVSGRITAAGSLLKGGQGTLTVTGQNLWNGNTIYLANGTLRGNSASLNTSIVAGDFYNQGRPTAIEFNQTFDGVHTHAILGPDSFIKTGNGTLTLTAPNSIHGETRVEQGTLALFGAGTLSHVSARGNVDINRNATLDLSSVDGSREIGILSGGGSLRLGKFLLTGGSANSTFNGVISGVGGLGKDGTGTLTLTAANSYAGPTSVVAGTLALVGAGSIDPRSSLHVGGTFDMSAADGNRSAGSLSGYGTVRIGTNTLTVGYDNTNTKFAGFIEGQGGLTKVGSGTLTLLGDNGFPHFQTVYGQALYNGPTTIEGGTLVTSVWGISSNVINHATLELSDQRRFGAEDFSIYSGTIKGTGNLVKSGDGFIWLRGRNTFTGGTEIKEGALIGNTDSLQGNIVNNATLAFYQVDNGTYSGTLSGRGTLLQYGPGVLTLTGTNTYTGGTVFSSTLRVTRDENLGAASGALAMVGGMLQIGADMTTSRDILLGAAGGTFDTNGNRLTLNGQVFRGASDGALIKTGAGALTLNGYVNTSAVAVNAGRLEVGSLLLGDTTVAPGAELGGTGTIQGTVVNRGGLAIGSGLGTLTVMRDFTFEKGSAFTLKVDADGRSDRLQLVDPLTMPQPIATAATGATTTTSFVLGPRAIVNGGTVDVRAENGNYRRSTQYNIISADGGVTGQFSGVTSNLAFLDPSLSYDPNNVYLTLKRNDLNYASVAQNPNQTNIAQALTRLANNPTGDAAMITEVLDSLSAAQARAAFDSIGGAGRTLMPQSLNINQRSVNQTLVARLGLADSGNSLAPAIGIAGRAVMLAYDENTRNDASPVVAQLGLPSGTGFRASTADTNNGLWLRGYGGSGRLDGDAATPGAKYHFGGALLGYDHRFGNATVGVFAGYGEPRYNQDFSVSSAKTKTVQAGVYGRYVSGAWHIDGVASYARNDTDTSRLVSVGGLNRAASGSFNGHAVSAHVETGYTVKLKGFELQPLAALSWVRQSQNAYSETGAGALNLILPEQHQDSLRSSLGVRTLHPFSGAGMQWTLETRAAWSHEFKTTRSVNARLAGDPAAGVFTVSGPSVPRDSAVLGVGIAAQASKNLRLYADVNAELSRDSRAYAVSAGLRYQW